MGALGSQVIALASEVAVARCRELAVISDAEHGTTRTFLSKGMRRANDRVAAWMRAAGMDVRMDAAGNLRGRTRVEGTPLVVASHLDTVPNAGAFDGVLGVMIGLGLAEMCGTSLPFPLELIGFSEEEGVRFGVPFIGSRAVVGLLDDALLSRQDDDGVSVRAAITAYGLDVERLPEARLTQARGYVEFHIEQGPVLESEGLAVGVVSSITGQSRYAVTFTGSANHAGTTPMHLRQDAVTAAAAWIVEVERYARETGGVVATVGSVRVQPDVGNAVAGSAVCSLDVRGAEDAVREQSVDYLLGVAEREGNARGVGVAVELRMQQNSVPMDDGLTQMLWDAVAETGLPVRRMVSGAGHDAMVIAPHIPAALLFLRTLGGLSHHPDESVRTEDVAAALRVGAGLLQRMGDAG